MWSALLSDDKQHTHTTQHEALSTTNLAAMFFCFLFLKKKNYFPSFANCRRVVGIGRLPGLSYFKLNTSASTPSPLSACSRSVTNTYILDVRVEGQHVQQQLAAKKCNKWNNCRVWVDLLPQQLWTPNISATTATGTGSFCWKNHIALWMKLR